MAWRNKQLLAERSVLPRVEFVGRAVRPALAALAAAPAQRPEARRRRWMISPVSDRLAHSSTHITSEIYTQTNEPD